MRKSIANSPLLTLVTILFICLFGAVIINACRKYDHINENTETDKTKIFFQVPDNAPSVVKRIAGLIYKQNNQYHFINKFVKEQGFAIWGKAIVTIAPLVTSHSSSRSSNTSGTDAKDTIVIIPLVKDQKNYVHGFLACKAGKDSIKIKLMDGSTYPAYGFTNKTDSLSAEFLAAYTMYFDYTVFNHDVFEVTDLRLFNYRQLNSRGPRYLKISPDTRSRGHGYRVNNGILITETWCFTATVQDDQPRGFRISTLMAPDIVCFDYSNWIDIIDGSDVNIPPPSGGGGDGDPWYNSDPCKVMPGDNPCGGGGSLGWMPFIPDNNSQSPIDSTKLKEIYQALEDSANYYYNRSDLDSAEWCFTITRKNNVYYNRNSKTDHDPNFVTPNLNVPSGDTVIGFWHAHEGNISYSDLDLCFSPEDILYIYRKLRVNNTIMYATTKNYVYALVITDVQKFKTWLDGQSMLAADRLNDLFSQGEASCTSGCTTSRLNELGVIKIADAPSNSGIKVYKSLRSNLLFTTLN